MTMASATDDLRYPLMTDFENVGDVSHGQAVAISVADCSIPILTQPFAFLLQGSLALLEISGKGAQSRARLG